VQPENLKFGGGAEGAVLHPAVVIALIFAALLIFLLPKRQVIVPVLLMVFLVPLAQQIYVGGLHVLVLRIVILIGLMRALFSMVFSKARGFGGGFGTLDKIFLWWTFFHVVTFLFLFSFQSGAVTNQFGFVWDSLGGFLLMRFLIQDEEDIDRLIKTFALLAGIFAICMLNERFRMQNVFGILGGVRLTPETRDGLVRAEASFSHPLLAGTFGATLLPLFFLYWHSGKSKTVAVIGILSATIMTICASSSTPFLAYAAGIGAVCFWPLRKRMRLIRWGILIVLVTLNIVMKAPVWFLISHISLFGSSSSDHRAYLVDAFVRHFSDWWLLGTNDAGNWGWDMWDTSNQYIAEGEGGGLASFICFLAMISLCFSWIGKARKAVEGDRTKEWYFWFLGAAMFANVVGFFGVSYFDQTRIMWYALLAVIATATSSVLGVKSVTEEQDDAGLVNSRLAPVPAPSNRRPSDVVPYKHA
jgi:hypothetical protein